MFNFKQTQLTSIPVIGPRYSLQKVWRCSTIKKKFGDDQPYDIVWKIKVELTTGGDEDWGEWRCLNRLRVGVGMTKAWMKQYGYLRTP